MKNDTLFLIISLLFAAACVIVILKCEIGRRSDDVFVAERTLEANCIGSQNSDEYSGTVRININEAGAEQLAELPGIGNVIAENIVKYRKEYGGFESVEEIMEVDGIGEGRFEKIKDLITV